jgi:hypothetical protein
MKSGMEVLLPEVQTEMALARLRRLHNTHDLLNRRLDVVDLRLEDRVTLRPKKAGSVKLLSSTEGDKADRDNVARLIEGMITDDDAGAANDETGREKFGRGETGRDRINNGINDAL